MFQKPRIAVLASGQGTNAERIFSHFKVHPFVTVALVLSSSPKAPVLGKAKAFQIPAQSISPSQWQDINPVVRLLQKYQITHLVLAGFLWLIPSQIVALYRHRIINIHPSLLPHYGGKGMYGSKVHAAVKQAGESESGITIHLVDEQYDTGKIIFRSRCKINPEDTTDTIAAKVRQLEHRHYPAVIERWLQASS